MQNHPKSIDSLLKQNKNEQLFQNFGSDALMSHLKSLNKDKKFPMFHECLFWRSIK